MSSKDPLHGVTLETMVNHLVSRYGWEELGQIIPVRCFQWDPSVSSSLKFLRRTPWARQKVESLYLHSLPGSSAGIQARLITRCNPVNLYRFKNSNRDGRCSPASLRPWQGNRHPA